MNKSCYNTTTMLKVQLLVLTVILIVFGTIFWITQRNSIMGIGRPGPTPSVSLPAEITPLVTLAVQGQQKQQQQPQQESAEVQGPPQASYSATLRTTKGNIVIALELKDGNSTVQNFISKVRSNYWNNLTFHRVEGWVIQGGDPKGDGTGGGAFVSELNQKPFTTGSVGWAASSAMEIGQGARVSNDSQFFIVKQDASHLDGQYSNFGTVTSGMDVVNRIQPGDKILGITIK